MLQDIFVVVVNNSDSDSVEVIGAFLTETGAELLKFALEDDIRADGRDAKVEIQVTELRR